MGDASEVVKKYVDTTAKITDEGIARMRERIGVVAPGPKAQDFPALNEYATLDGFRHFAYGYGDDNPLWCDEQYGRKSHWRGVIAPPLFLTTMGISETQSIRPELRSRGAHALAGVHEFFSGDEWEWFLPTLPGDRMTTRYYLYDVVEKPHSRFSGGRSLITKYRVDYLNQRKELAAVDRYYFVRTERDAAAKTKKNFHIERTKYTPEMIKEIEDAYAAEQVQGSTPRYWEDVKEGESLPQMVRGPMNTSDIIAWMRGWGGAYGWRIAWKYRMRRPKFYSLNEWGVPDVVERGHWEQAWANKIGNPYPYDFGRLRSCFLSQLVSNWMGDTAWFWKMSNQFRQFNYLGDTTWVRGKVLKKQIDEDGHHLVDIDMWCENQRGEVTAPGKATVILPSREAGPVVLPKPSAKTEGTVPLLY